MRFMIICKTMTWKHCTRLWGGLCCYSVPSTWSDVSWVCSSSHVKDLGFVENGNLPLLPEPCQFPFIYNKPGNTDPKRDRIHKRSKVLRYSSSFETLEKIPLFANLRTPERDDSGNPLLFAYSQRQLMTLLHISRLDLCDHHFRPDQQPWPPCLSPIRSVGKIPIGKYRHFINQMRIFNPSKNMFFFNRSRSSGASPRDGDWRIT